ISVDTDPWGSWPQLSRRADSWWMSVELNGRKIDAYTLNEGGVTSRSRLVTHTCVDAIVCGFDVRNHASVVWGDELWYGFWDFTDGSNEPYRIVRVKDGCTYSSMRDILRGNGG